MEENSKEYAIIGVPSHGTSTKVADAVMEKISEGKQVILIIGNEITSAEMLRKAVEREGVAMRGSTMIIEPVERLELGAVRVESRRHSPEEFYYSSHKRGKSKHYNKSSR